MILATLRKALADFRVRRLQTFLLFVVIAAAAATLTLALTVQSSASEPYQRTIRESNMADLWIQVSAPGVDVDAIAKAPGVKATSGPYPMLYRFSISSAEKKQELGIVGMDPELPAVDHPVVTDGRWLAAGGTDELVLDRGAARRLGFEPGDRVEVLTDSGTVPFQIVGLAVPAGRAPAPIDEEPFAFVLRGALDRLSPGATFGTPGYVLRLGVQLTGSDDALPQFLAAAEPVLSSGDARVDETRDEIAQNIEESNLIDVIFLGVFSVFALAAAGLIIANAMAAQVLSQRRDVGLLKTLGFTPGQVTFVFLAESVALTIAASAVGIVCGLLAAPFFLERTAELLGVTAAPVVDLRLILITVVVVTAIVTVFTSLSAWQAGRVSPIESLTSKGRGSSRRSWFGALASLLHLPVVVVLGVKDLSSHPWRTLATTIALVLAVVTATFTLGMEATFSETLHDPTSVGGPPFDLLVDRDIYSPEEAVQLLDSRPEIERYVVRTDVDAAYGDVEFELRALDGDLSDSKWVILAGRMVEASGEVMIGSGFAADLGVDVGDRITVDTLEDRGRLDLLVVGRYLEFDDEIMMTPRSTLPDDFLPTDYLIKTVPGTDDRAFGVSLLQASGGHFDPEVVDDSIAEIRGQFRTVILSFNGVLFAIAAINLLSTLMLGIRESQRDFAVFKTLGLMPAQIGASVFAGSTVLAVAAVIIGIPVGLGVTLLLFDILSEAANLGASVGALPSVGSLLLILPGAIILAGLGTVLPARVAAAIRPTDALRYE